MSSHFGVAHHIAGNNVHLPATQAKKHKWFIYLEECIHMVGTYQFVGSTDSMTHRWANTKSKIKCLANGGTKKAGTGLEKHYQVGCSEYSGEDLKHIRITLLEQFNTNEESLRASNHQEGPGCRCSQCEKLKNLEDKWICRLGTLLGFHQHSPYMANMD